MIRQAAHAVLPAPHPGEPPRHPPTGPIHPGPPGAGHGDPRPTTTFSFPVFAAPVHHDRWRDEIDRAEAIGSLVALFLVVAGTGVAGTVATLSMTGAVPLALNITVTPTPAASQLDLSLNQPPLTVAGVTVASNNMGGYRVTVGSANVAAGNCANPCLFTSGGGNASLPFTLHRNGSPIGFSGGSGTFVTGAGLSQPGGDTHLAQVSFDGTGVNLPRNNAYTETLTFTLAVN